MNRDILTPTQVQDVCRKALGMMPGGGASTTSRYEVRAGRYVEFTYRPFFDAEESRLSVSPELHVLERRGEMLLQTPLASAVQRLLLVHHSMSAMLRTLLEK